jgi:hypothetical protein
MKNMLNEDFMIEKLTIFYENKINKKMVKVM